MAETKVQQLIGNLAEKLKDTQTRHLFPAIWSQIDEQTRNKIKNQLIQVVETDACSTSSTGNNAAMLLGMTCALEPQLFSDALTRLLENSQSQDATVAKRSLDAIRVTIEEMVRCL